ncbi:type II secretion system minor pseudopilin GspK [Pantoea endophytica]
MTAQRGMALITVLLIIALMTLLAVAGQRQWVQALTRTASQQFQQQAQWTLRGAETWLLNQSDKPLDGRVQQLRLDQQTVSYRWRDRQSCFNLNALGQNGRTDKDGVLHRSAAQRVFAHLLQQQGMDQPAISILLIQIHQQLNAGNNKQWPLLADKTEIRHLSLLAEPRWSNLAPLLCALPSSELNINLNALQADQASLLMALLEGEKDRSQILSLLQKRPERGWPTLDAFISALPGGTAVAVSTLQSIAVLESQHWELLIWLADEQQFAAIRSQWIRHQDLFTLHHRQYGLSEAP